MVDPIRIDFGAGSDPGRFGSDSGPRHFNSYVAKVIEGKGPGDGVTYYASDGFDTFSTDFAGSNVVNRGLLDFENGCLTIVGSQLAHVDSGGTGQVIGGITGSHRVIMAKNNASTPQAVIVLESGQKFVVTPDGVGGFTLAEITDVDLPSANSCTYLNQRIIYGIDDGRFFWSDVNDATAIDALNFATAEGDPDGLVRAFAHNQEIWLFGQKTTEVWRDTGATTAPFRRNTGAVFEKGLMSRHSVAAVDKDLIWLGQDGTVYRAIGYQWQRISNHGLEDVINASTNQEDIIAFSRLTRGHHFYTLTSPPDGWTWEWNRTTGMWCERKSANINFWRINGVCPSGDDYILGDYDDGNLYKINKDTYDEAGANLVWTLRSAPLHAFPNRLSVYFFHADFETGVGLVDAGDAHDSDPQVGLRWSDDGGDSWSNQLFRPLGKIGETNVRVSWDNLGLTERTGRIWELEVSSPVARALTYTAIEADKVGT